MLTVKGIYNGNEFVALENFPKNKNLKVIITFVEELDEDAEIRDFSSQTDTLDFWKDEREDLYQDFLTFNKNMKTGEIITAKRSDVIAVLGKLSETDL